ncbi:MAG: methyltransferase family protein [Acidiferrobacter sp.]
MWRRALINVALFELVLMGVIGRHWGAFYDIRGVVFNAGLVLWLGMESARVRLGHKMGVITVGKFSRMFLIVSIAAVVLAAGERAHRGSSFMPTLPVASVYAGALLFVMGVYLRHLSIKQLGQYFVTKIQITKDHQLVTDGLYRYIRHPSYTGLILGFLGAILFLRASFAATLFVVIGIPAYVYRIRIEESALLGVFGQYYTDYREKTRALLPYIY